MNTGLGILLFLILALAIPLLAGAAMGSIEDEAE